jgi:flagellar biosynthesis protein FlhG
MMDQAQKLRDMATNTIATGSKPRILTVTSGKGGVGKSNVVVNLAITLQKLGKRVMIFDADIGMGNDDVLMGFVPKYNVFDMIFNKKNIDEVLITGPYGVRLLSGGSGLAKVDELTNDERKMVLNQFEGLSDFDFIIMDTGAGINRSVLGFVDCCEELIILTTPEPTSLTDAYSLIKVIDYFNIKKSAKVIINRVRDEKEGELIFQRFNKAVSSFLKIELVHLGSVCEDRKIVQAVMSQQPFVVAYPNCDASKNLNDIAKNILGRVDTIDRFGIKELFSKIFNNFS